jgi:hypothetical protein
MQKMRNTRNMKILCHIWDSVFDGMREKWDDFVEFAFMKMVVEQKDKY